MQTKNGKNIFKIKSKIYFNLLIFTLVKTVFSRGTIKTEYNFGNRQNPEIDKSYNHVLGRNVYFVTETPERTMYITAIYPYLTLEVKLKIYTDSSTLINAFNNGEQIYFGFDLLIENMDRENPNPSNYDKYRTDIMICVFSKTDVDCHDYIYDITAEEYIINDNAVILNNNLIPLGYKNINLNFIQKNVMDYKNYFSVFFEKEYPPLFDNITMFNWINYVASDAGEGVIGFYGVVTSGMNMARIRKADISYLEQQDFIDGTGLPDSYCIFLNKMNLFINLFLILFLIL
jgi:hypothetical protein